MINTEANGKRVQFLLMSLLITLFLIPFGRAGEISLRITNENLVSYPEDMEMNISVKNLGNEVARSVEIVPILPSGLRTNNLIIGDLPPEERFTGKLNFSKTEEFSLGIYPLVLRVEYADMNQYPFSVLASSYFENENSSRAYVGGAMNKIEITKEGSGSIELKLRNMDEKSHEVKINLYSPKEIKVETPQKKVNIEGQGTKEISFNLESFGALPGSSYFLIASVEYEDGLHKTSLAKGMVEIVEEKSGKNTSKGGGLNLKLLLLIVFVILLVIYLVYKLRGKL